MRNSLKILVALVALVLIVGLSYAAAVLVPNTTTMELDTCYGLTERVAEHDYLIDWDEETGEGLVESSALPKGNARIEFSYRAVNNASFTLAQMNSEWEEIAQETIDVQPGERTVVFSLEEAIDSFALTVTDANVSFTKIRLVKQGAFNSNALILVVFLLSAITLLIAFRHYFTLHPEYGFLFVGLCILIVMVAIFPTDPSVVWDAGDHYERIELLSLTAQYDTPLKNVLNELNINDMGYIPGAIALRVASLFTADADIITLAIRLFSALVYLVVCFFAVKLAKRYQMLFAIAALTPVAIFLSASFSYDMVVNAFVLFSLSLMVSEIVTPNERVKPGRTALMLCTFLFASFPKAVYAPIMLVLLGLPQSKFASRKQQFFYKLSIVMVFLGIMATFVLPALLSAPSMSGDLRGGNVNPSIQIGIILGTPFEYAALLIQNVVAQFSSIMMNMTSAFAFVGNTSVTCAYLFIALFIITALTDVAKKDKSITGFHWTHRVWFLLIIIATVSLVFTSMFIAFTEIGQTWIAGVQPRYFIPLLPMAMLIICPNKLPFLKKHTALNTGLFIASLVLNFAAMAELCIF